jgi:hypothetical protein
MWIEEELQKNATETQETIHALTRDYRSRQASGIAADAHPRKYSSPLGYIIKIKYFLYHHYLFM